MKPESKQPNPGVHAKCKGDITDDLPYDHIVLKLSRRVTKSKCRRGIVSLSLIHSDFDNGYRLATVVVRL